MPTVRILTEEQTEKVRIFLRTLAELRGQEFVEPGDMLPYLTGPYNFIQLDGGGDPVKAAQRLV